MAAVKFVAAVVVDVVELGLYILIVGGAVLGLIWLLTR